MREHRLAELDPIDAQAAQERWFPMGMRLFGAAALISLTMVMIGGFLPVRLLSLVALAAAVLGFGTCALGLRVCNPEQWRAGVGRLQWKLGLREYPPLAMQEPHRPGAGRAAKRSSWPATA